MAKSFDLNLSQTLENFGEVWFSHDDKLFHIWESDSEFQYDEFIIGDDDNFNSYNQNDGGVIESSDPLKAIEFITQG